MQDYLVLYTANGVEKSEAANSEELALDYAIAIIDSQDPEDIRIIRNGSVIFSCDQIIDHPRAAGKIRKALPRLRGSFGGKINLP
jgi:hypothetical protein